MHLVRLFGREFLVVQAGIDDPEAEEEYEPTLVPRRRRRLIPLHR